jgi:hypothetical protein
LLPPLIALIALVAAAQEAPIEVNPNRPTFATPALTTQFGVAELEFGVQQSFLHRADTAFSSPTLVKLGVVKDFEIRISTNGYLDFGHSGAPSVSGLADVTLGVQWCYTHTGIFGTDEAIQFTHKFATADAAKGLGSGAADDTLALFVSRDIGRVHLDINLLDTLLGRPHEDGGGTVSQPAGTVSVSYTITNAWSCGGELYAIGTTPLNRGVLSNLWYVARKASTRLVLDAGVDIGLNRAAQRYSVFAGLTYGIGRFRKMPGR